jgi:uncharacterized protein (AIM24 family)
MEYEIIGDNLQMVVANISPGEMVYGEAGAMVYMCENVDMTAKILQAMTIKNLAAALRPYIPFGSSGESKSSFSIGGLLGD